LAAVHSGASGICENSYKIQAILTDLWSFRDHYHSTCYRLDASRHSAYKHFSMICNVHCTDVGKYKKFDWK
jgi:hypothetical protein